jgi:uracil-DNA glycosylase family 4
MNIHDVSDDPHEPLPVSWHLDRLTKDLKHCKSCYLHKNGMVLPEITEHSKYIMLMEQPLRDRPEYLDKFWELFRNVGLSRQEFVILHTVQCYTDKTKRKSKHKSTMPSRLHREECRPWLHAYIQTLRPEKMLVMGNIAMEHVCGEFDGITEKNATVTKPKMGGIITPCVLSVSPNFLKWDGDGKKMLRKSLVTFKDL